jgi:hypothetical protein
MKKNILKSRIKATCTMHHTRQRRHGALAHPVIATVLAFGAGLAQAQSTDNNANNAVPARAASLATAQAINTVITQNPLTGSGAFRFRLGEKTPPPGGSGMAAGDSSNWSIWATPVVSTFRNNIAPYTSNGTVTMALAGIEYNSDDVMVTGISLAADSTNSQTNSNGGTYKSTGVTVSQYLV